MSREVIGTRRHRRRRARLPVRLMRGGLLLTDGVALDLHPSGIGVLLSMSVSGEEVQVAFATSDGQDVMMSATIEWMESGRPARGGLRLHRRP